MAICGHYCPPMSHSQAPLLLWVFSTTLALTPWWLLLLMFMLSFSPLRHNTLTHQYACSHARRCLSVSKMGEIHRQAPNMECLMEDLLMLLPLTEYILRSISFCSCVLCAASSISPCLPALFSVYQLMSGPSYGLDHCGLNHKSVSSEPRALGLEKKSHSSWEN